LISIRFEANHWLKKYIVTCHVFNVLAMKRMTIIKRVDLLIMLPVTNISQKYVLN